MIRRAGRLTLYAAGAVVPGIVVGLLTVFLLATSLVLSVTQVGLPVLAAVLAGARRAGSAHRRALAGALRIELPGPRPRRHETAVRSRLTDGDAWRAVPFDVAAAPLLLLLFAVTVPVRLYALAAVAYPVWRLLLDPAELSPFLNSAAGQAAAVGLGLAALVAAHWAARGLAAVLVLLARPLLGPGRLTSRVRELEETRSRAVQDSAATLRRIERDLHDGAQARLTAVAMSLAGARSRLEPGEARDLVEHALDNTRTAIGELRELVRGIHPPALNSGLGPALESLATRTAAPVRLRIDLPAEPPAAIAAIAYFCAAELLANATRHAAAGAVELTAEERDGRLLLRVRDDGRGGARLLPGAPGGSGTGLSGLAERVRTVDGRLDIDSPDGGPTLVTAELPMEP